MLECRHEKKLVVLFGRLLLRFLRAAVRGDAVRLGHVPVRYTSRRRWDHKKEGVKWGGITEELGDGKTVTEGVPLTVALPCAAVKCWALDEAGAHRDEVPVEVCGGKTQVCVGPAFRTIWYEIEVVR